MRKIVFCEVAWMKYYGGVQEDDKPINGGKYIAENETGGEVFNFAPYNHKCYGYVMHYGDELHIERYDKILKSFDEVRDVTVIWVASDGKRSKIVGWYENATMYRFWQSFYDVSYCGDKDNYYNFVAHEKDCYLIPEEERTFVVPRASVAGKGRGMGQSQVWYADSEYAQNEFIPEVLEYLESMKNKRLSITFDMEEISECAEDNGETVEELIEISEVKFYDEEVGIVDGFRYINLAISKEDSFRTRFTKAGFYREIGWYDEAEEEYKLALYYEENLGAMENLMYVELMLGHTFLAIELGEKVRKRKDESRDGLWEAVANNLVRAYINEQEYELAENLITECEGEKNNEHLWIENEKEFLQRKKAQHVEVTFNNI